MSMRARPRSERVFQVDSPEEGRLLHHLDHAFVHPRRLLVPSELGEGVGRVRLECEKIARVLLENPATQLQGGEGFVQPDKRIRANAFLPIEAILSG